jgi:TolA-binding protein
MLEDKDDEIEQLLALKARMENGEDLNLSELAELGPGLSGRTKILESVESELDQLKAELEELRFQEKFRLAANLKEAAGEDETALLDEQPPVEEIGEPAVVIPTMEDMREAAEAAVSEEGGVAVNLMKLAETYYRTGRFDKAWEVFERIDRAAHPQGDRILYMIGRCRERLHDLAGAKEAYEEVEKVYPGTFWSDQAKFALSVLDWKIELGPIEGVPPEVRRVLDGNKATAK